MKILKLNPENIKEILKESLSILKSDKVIACPTDTVYGLVANAVSEKAVNKVFKIKERSFLKPVPVFVKSIRMAQSLACISKKEEMVLRKFWPGQLTAVLKARPVEFPLGILSKDEKIGLRMPDYFFLKLLFKEISFPLTGTSANISGRESCRKTHDVLEQFKEKKYQPDILLDGGELKKNPSSTVVDLISFEIVREGGISSKEIFKFLNI